MSKYQLVLASSSKSRQQQLMQMNHSFHTTSPDIDESRLLGEDVKKMVVRLAQQKAETAKKDFNDHFIIGADQVQYVNGKIQGKPHTIENAIKQLSNSSDKITFFYSGICVLHSTTNTYLTI